MNFDQLFGNTGDGVYVVDLNGIIQYWNGAAQKLLGYSAREVVGMPCHKILGAKDASSNRLCRECCAVQMQAGDGEPINHFEMSCTTSSGKPVWLDTSIITVQTNSGARKLIVHLIRDATSSHQLQVLLRERSHDSETIPEPDQPALVVLTAREREVLSLLKQGANTATAAEKLFISRATVRNHIQNIFSKLGVHTRLEAVAYLNGQKL